MRPVRMTATLTLVLAAGCAGVTGAPPAALPQHDLLMVDPSLLGREQDSAAAAQAKEAASATLAPSPALPRQPAMTGNEAAKDEAATAAPALLSASQSAATAAPPPARTPARASAPPAAIEQPRKIEDPPPAARKAEPPLDVAALKARLRDTPAIGVFTKLALKNQVDDLLSQFRAHYLSGQKTNVAALRQPYDMLVLKVLALIQDGDPSLARTISGSREAIWGILADPEKFNSAS